MRNEPGDMEESETLFKDAMDWFEIRKDRWSQAFCHDILSQIYMLKDDYEQAISAVQTEHDILHPQLGDWHIDIGINYLMRANIYRHFGREEDAIKYYNKAIDIIDKLGLKHKKELVVDIIESGGLDIFHNT